MGAGVAMNIRVLGVGLVGSFLAACGDSSDSRVDSSCGEGTTEVQSTMELLRLIRAGLLQAMRSCLISNS